ncbi:hypothetical protein HNR71_000704 [Kribbella sandramycini]|uniref:Uncharacterized protein n=1 Tax=Kribbella sandramycini TaxID=60450 RepID=A0A841S2M7_9ACTN|nr:hypothetical protein [Kribbella sandramycini]
MPFEETVRRHATRAKAAAFGAAEMAEWYLERDLLERPRERVVGADSSLQATVQRIVGETGLGEVQVGDVGGVAGG